MRAQGCKGAYYLRRLRVSVPISVQYTDTLADSKGTSWNVFECYQQCFGTHPCLEVG